MKQLASRLSVMVLIVLLIGVFGYLAGNFGSMEWLVENESRMRTFVETYPLQGWLLGFAIYTLFSMVPGTAGKSVVWGWVFGFWPAVLMVDAGLTIAAVASFLVGRFLVRKSVEKRYSRLIVKLNHHLAKDTAFYLLMLRVAHVPFSLVNYSAGTTSIRLSTFTWTTLLGLLPGTMIFVFVGTRIPTLTSIKEHGVWQLLDPLLISLLVATFVFPLIVRLAMKIYRKRGGDESELRMSEIESLDEWAIGGQGR